MLSLEELAKKVQSYRDGGIDCDVFEDWFRPNSWGMYDRAGDPMSDAIAVIRSALAAFDCGEIDKNEFRQELAAAVLPFAQGSACPVRSKSA